MNRLTPRMRPGAVAIAMVILVQLGASSTRASVVSSDVLPLPRVRGDLPACAEPLRPAAVTERGAAGERLVYRLELLGMHVGDVHFEAAARGTFKGRAATIYRSWLQADGLVEALVRIEGRTTSVVADDSFLPLESVTQYRFRSDRIDEKQQRSEQGRSIVSTSTVNGRRRSRDDAFATDTHDFISSFLLLRRLPQRAQGCAVVYTHDRLYTAWVEPNGTEVVVTPQGKVQMERYRVRYGTSTGKTVREVRIWLWPGSDRIPYQLKGESEFSPVIRLASYRAGAAL